MILDAKQVNKAVQALKLYDSKEERSELFEAGVIQLQLGFKKIPRHRNKIIKIALPHPLVCSTTDVCLFVKDLDRDNRDYSATVNHFKDLLQEHRVKGISEVIPLKSLKTEYQPYEAKKNLSNKFDIYLADERIVRLLPAFLGKNFYKRKKYPVQVNLKAKDLKKEIKRALGLTQCVVSGRGSTCQVIVSNLCKKDEHAVENIVAVVNKLAETIPGGAQNIKTLHLKTTHSPALPIYLSLESPNDIEVPNQKRKFELDEPEDVTTVMHGKVRVTPFGAIQVINETSKDYYNKKGQLKANAKKQIQKLRKEKLKKKLKEETDDSTVKEDGDSTDENEILCGDNDNEDTHINVKDGIPQKEKQAKVKSKKKSRNESNEKGAKWKFDSKESSREVASDESEKSMKEKLIHGKKKLEAQKIMSAKKRMEKIKFKKSSAVPLKVKSRKAMKHAKNT